MLRPHSKSGLHWDSRSSAPSISLRQLSMAGWGEEGSICYLNSALKWKSSIPSRQSWGHGAPLLRFLLFGVLQALKERLFKEIQLPQGHSEEGGHVANEDAGPRIVAPSKERNKDRESV